MAAPREVKIKIDESFRRCRHLTTSYGLQFG